MAAVQPTVAAITPSRFERVTDLQKWIYARIAERDYARRLVKVAQVIGTIVDGHSADPIADAPEIIEQLNRYALLIRPWAKAVAGRMLADVARRDKKVWMDRARKMGRALREELSTDAPTGRVLRESLQRQVGLITSLPTEAAERVHRLTVEAQSSGARASRIADMIMASGEVSRSRAVLIARTEASRTASNLVEVRARAIGSEGYTWQTSRDSDVRESHKALQGKFIRWDSPPLTDIKLGPYHAGCGPNCRCFPIPVLPDRV